MSQFQYVLLALALFYLIYKVTQLVLFKIQNSGKIHQDVDVQPVLEGYDWRTEKIPQYRPFKPNYREVMNIGRITHEEWLTIDSDYEMITDHHQKVMRENPESTCLAADTPETKAATQELYDFTMCTFVQRYPQYFEVKGAKILNKIKGRELPRKAAASGLSSEELLRVLCENAEEDFLLLEYHAESDEYMQRAAAGVSSVNYLWTDKNNKKMTDIHARVPGYKEKLQFSMNKYFSKMKVGQWVQRITWLIQIADSPHEEWRPSANRSFFGAGAPNFDTEVYARVTRQILSRLPQSKFLAFTQRTYFYPLSQIKAEGYGGVLADNIATMPDDVAAYRGRPSWGEPVINYLRS